MTFVPDDTLRHLREVAEIPDLSDTKYEVVRPVARGGMGVIYLAHDRELDREVALKVLYVPDMSTEAAARIINEARILAELEHPGIVPVHDVGTLPDGRVFYTMKLVKGRRLDEHMAHGGLELPELLRVFGRVCEAVAFAHSRGVVHRDLTPANVMVGPFGEVLVMDWGVAKALSPPPTDDPPGESTTPATPAEQPETGQGTDPGTILGTPGYMSPEQRRGEVDRIDRRTDVFALGTMLRNLARTSASGTLPKRLAAICDKATAESPADRYQSVEVLGRDVTRFVAGEAVSAYRERLWDRAARVAIRHKTPIALILAYILMRALLIILSPN
jgi:serine/threonine-protein kinase